ncbi:MAG: hypothetical protein PVS2B1_01800 [Candidatus Dormibacteraceae bacterium]
MAILRSCRNAKGLGARLLVVEALMPAGNEPSFGKTQDINMLINVGGSERTEVECRALYEAAGFKLSRCIPLMGELHIVEACRSEAWHITSFASGRTTERKPVSTVIASNRDHVHPDSDHFQ